MVELLPKNANREIIRCCIHHYPFLSHITTSGKGRFNEVIVDEINEAITAYYRSHVYTDTSGLRSGHQKSQPAARRQVSKSADSAARRRIPIPTPRDIWILHYPGVTQHHDQGNDFCELPLQALLWKCMTKVEIVREMRKELSEEMPSEASKIERIEHWIVSGDPRKNKTFGKNYALFRKWRSAQRKKRTEKLRSEHNLEWPLP